MKVYQSIEEFPKHVKSILTLGTFDGVHIGHRYIVRKLNDIARNQKGESVLLTFHPHPRHILYPDDQELKLINTIQERKEQLERAGLNHLIIQEFSKDFSRMSAVRFVRDILVNQLRVCYLVVGHDHHFGRNREGSYAELEELSSLYGFSIDRVLPQKLAEISVSSTKIRKAIRDGDLLTAKSYLGYDFYFESKVVRGLSIGSSIDYPTANLQSSEKSKIQLGKGVYAVLVYIEGNKYYGMMNIGVRPTFEQSKHTVEVHIFDFQRDIYNINVKVVPLIKIRSEKKFENIRLLKEQLQKDEVEARLFFSKK